MWIEQDRNLTVKIRFFCNGNIKIALYISGVLSVWGIAKGTCSLCMT